jgi:hypothetical protein
MKGGRHDAMTIGIWNRVAGGIAPAPHQNMVEV